MKQLQLSFDHVKNAAWHPKLESQIQFSTKYNFVSTLRIFSFYFDWCPGSNNHRKQLATLNILTLRNFAALN